MTNTIDLDMIRAVARLITEHFDVERIVLFGSYARGDADGNSDIDLLVEMHPECLPTGSGNPIRRLIAKHFVLPIDVVVQSTDIVDKHRNEPYSLIYQVFKDGVIIYDRQSQTLV
jgi:predicted nucleotidyltransferase